MTKAEQTYADIIHLSRPEPAEILREYPRQPMSERAKIFSPFAALRGHEERLSSENDRLSLVEQAELSEEDQRALSEKIGALKKGTRAELTYFEMVDQEQNLGRYQSVLGTVLETDPVLGRIRLQVEEKNEMTAGTPGKEETKISFLALSGVEILD